MHMQAAAAVGVGGIVFLKLGGSALTDKQGAASSGGVVRGEEELRRISEEIGCGLRRGSRGIRLVVGHGSGSFGHNLAHEYGTRKGVRSLEEWGAFARIGANQRDLNLRVARALQEAGVPAFPVAPGSSLVLEDGKVSHMDTEVLARAVASTPLVPLVHGDVALDNLRGGTIASTEEIFQAMAEDPRLEPHHIIFAGDTDGCYNELGHRIPKLWPGNIESFDSALKGSKGVDVTGGMRAKVFSMLALVEKYPNMTIRIINGLQKGAIRRSIEQALTPGDLSFGTLISAS